MRRIPPARTAGSSASRVVRHHRYGGPEVLTVDVVPIPVPGSGQVRVRVRAAGVNAIDWKRRRGLFAHGEPLREPAGTGIEGSGTIDAVGPDSPGWRVGQDVLGQVPTGAAATHVLAASDKLVAKPHWLGFEQAAALPVAAETASRTLRQLAVRGGQTLLIHAVAGGVGVLAAQLARARAPGWSAPQAPGTTSSCVSWVSSPSPTAMALPSGSVPLLPAASTRSWTPPAAACWPSPLSWLAARTR